MILIVESWSLIVIFYFYLSIHMRHPVPISSSVTDDSKEFWTHEIENSYWEIFFYDSEAQKKPYKIIHHFLKISYATWTFKEFIFMGGNHA